MRVDVILFHVGTVHWKKKSKIATSTTGPGVLVQKKESKTRNKEELQAWEWFQAMFVTCHHWFLAVADELAVPTPGGLVTLVFWLVKCAGICLFLLMLLLLHYVMQHAPGYSVKEAYLRAYLCVFYKPVCFRKESGMDRPQWVSEWVCVCVCVFMHAYARCVCVSTCIHIYTYIYKLAPYIQLVIDIYMASSHT